MKFDLLFYCTLVHDSNKRLHVKFNAGIYSLAAGRILFFGLSIVTECHTENQVSYVCT